MLKVLSRLPHQHIAYFFCLLLMVGLVLPNGMIIMSISMISLVLNALINVDIKKNLTQFYTHPFYLLLTIPFWLCLVSGLYSDNVTQWLARVQLKLPFLFLPFAFAALEKIPKKVYHMLSQLFVYIIVAACSYTLFIYYIDYEGITLRFRQGHSLPTPINHIRFSLMIVWAIISVSQLIRHKFYFIKKWERYGNGLIMVGLIIFLHILAARSGLIAFYLCVFYGLGILVFKYKKYKAAIAILLVGLSSLYVAQQYSPTLQHKINYTKYGIQQYLNGGQIQKYSDSKRIISITTGIAVGNENCLFGVGEGDIREEMDAHFQQTHPTLVGKKLLPHNQFVYFYATTGILGLLLFIGMFHYPLFYQQNYKSYLFVCFYIIIFSSCLTEHTLENQLGIAFYLLFLLLGSKHLEKAKTVKSD